MLSIFLSGHLELPAGNYLHVARCHILEYQSWDYLLTYIANGERLDKPFNSACTDQILEVNILTVHDIIHMSHSTSFPYDEEESLVNKCF